MKPSTKATLVGIAAAILGFVIAWLVIEWMLETLLLVFKLALAVAVALVLGAAGYIQYIRSRPRE